MSAAAKPDPAATFRCCIVGGGPAGMFCGYLLARAGIEVVVLEKHGDFLRDFRGDTVHPSTLEALHDLGLLDEFLKRPHQKIREVGGVIGDDQVVLGDFSHLPTHAKFIALMPQWDFLDFLVQAGRKLPTFRVRMNTEATDLIEEAGVVVGVRAAGDQGPVEVRADLVIAADGRGSRLRDRAGFEVSDLGAPIDVLWLRLPRRGDEPDRLLGRIQPGLMFVMIPRGDYFQCAFVVGKGQADAVKAEGLPAFRDKIAAVAPEMADRLGAIESWDDVKLLTVTVDRLEQWSKPGLLFIGDAAHAMSPVGGVGINLAIQDAIAAANLLWEPLREGRPSPEQLEAVRKRRLPAVALIQAIQVFAQDIIFKAVLNMKTGAALRAPWPVRLLDLFPVLRRIPARVIGLGYRMERVRSPDAFSEPTAAPTPRPWPRQALIALGIVAVGVVSLAAWVWRDDILQAALDPKVPYQTYRPPPAPDYAKASAWALRPGAGGPTLPVDVFFIHPTTYDGGREWNAPIDDARANRQLAEVMLPNYAGPFEMVGRLYAPRYRQASLYTLLTLRDDAREARRFAYGDVRAAFRWFLDHDNHGRPFILVGVEQGGSLAARLLREEVANDPALLQRMAGAYLIDTVVPRAEYAPDQPVHACQGRAEARCVIAWMRAPRLDPDFDTLGRALVWEGTDLVNLDGRDALCVNPLTGGQTDAKVAARENLGAVNASGLEWGARPAFLSRQVGAQCVGGVLRVTSPRSPTLRRTGGWADGKKEPPYNLFYADIEADARARVTTLLGRQAFPTPAAPITTSIEVRDAPIHRPR